MAEEEVQYDNPDRPKLREGLYLLFAVRYKKSSAPMRPKPSIWERIFYDHIHDHRHDRSTWRQDATRARMVIFAVAERSEKKIK